MNARIVVCSIVKITYKENKMVNNTDYVGTLFDNSDSKPSKIN